MVRFIGYARVSTDEQTASLEAQIYELSQAGCDLIFNEEVSSVAEREQLDAALADLKTGDKLVVCKLDRLARSVLKLWHIVQQLDERGVALRILNMGGETIDTKSATGKLILTVFAGFAQFEREMMLERQKIGIAKAQIEGKYRGRKPTAMAKADDVMKWHGKGASVSHIAREAGMSRASVYRILEAHEVPRDPVLGGEYRRFVSRRLDGKSGEARA
jgi:DNA invertase Pin-like site-specific DNA recombinase